MGHIVFHTPSFFLKQIQRDPLELIVKRVEIRFVFQSIQVRKEPQQVHKASERQRHRHVFRHAQPLDRSQRLPFDRQFTVDQTGEIDQLDRLELTTAGQQGPQGPRRDRSRSVFGQGEGTQVRPASDDGREHTVVQARVQAEKVTHVGGGQDEGLKHLARVDARVSIGFVSKALQGMTVADQRAKELGQAQIEITADDRQGPDGSQLHQFRKLVRKRLVDRVESVGLVLLSSFGWLKMANVGIERGGVASAERDGYQGVLDKGRITVLESNRFGSGCDTNDLLEGDQEGFEFQVLKTKVLIKIGIMNHPIPLSTDSISFSQSSSSSLLILFLTLPLAIFLDNLNRKIYVEGLDWVITFIYKKENNFFLAPPPSLLFIQQSVTNNALL